jgi:anti-sigma factor RsiW
MTQHEQELQLQAYVDGGLTQAESDRISRWIEKDPGARAVVDGLRRVRELMEVGEVEVSVPVNRAFYWSKIQEGISSGTTSRVANREPVRGSFWLRILVPTFGLAVLALVLRLWVSVPEEAETVARYFHEIDGPLAEGNAMTFHSEAAAMTVVWVDSRGFGSP